MFQRGAPLTPNSPRAATSSPPKIPLIPFDAPSCWFHKGAKITHRLGPRGGAPRERARIRTNFAEGRSMKFANWLVEVFSLWAAREGGAGLICRATKFAGSFGVNTSRGGERVVRGWFLHADGCGRVKIFGRVEFCSRRSVSFLGNSCGCACWCFLHNVRFFVDFCKIGV